MLLNNNVPKGNVRCWASTFDHPNSSHRRVMLSHDLNRSLTVVVSSFRVARLVEQSLAASIYYEGEVLPSVVLREQGIVALSQGPLEAGRWCKTTKVTIGLLKDAHEKLGLPGKGVGGLWITQLAADSQLLERLPRARCLACLHDNGKHPGGMPLQGVALKCTSKALPQLRWPVIDDSPQGRADFMERVLEWSGAVLAGTTSLVTHELRGNQMVPLFCSYQLRGLGQEVASESTSLTWTGMLHGSTCLRVVDVVRSALADDGTEWALFSVCGFPDALVSWGDVAHRPSWFGDHRAIVYTLFLNRHSYFGFVTGDDESLPL